MFFGTDRWRLGALRIRCEVMMKFAITFAALAVVLSGCSATSLRCSTDGDSSFVELVNIPQDIGGQSRYFKELCGFSFEDEREPVARLSIIDPNGSN